MQLTTETEEETKTLAEGLAVALEAGDIISLTGDLGAGKTRFVQGLADGLGIKKPVTSPTFTIIKQYDDGRLPLYHFDVYRLNGPSDLRALGYEEYFFGDGITVIEWGDKINDLLPPDHLTIEFHRTTESVNRRTLVFTSRGQRSEQLKKVLEHE
ncbi:MAG TPA: tRNA (adenosine(37)-N6)-threonylcarbamoyltransferase complex ATPase subunit type 1 TsaE [Actinobacteria bacterium]|nr:tRNA (adenosine(37)-N6)-threonylcarbamoyltransferase complex ATPase subunit type 1 TsaE [Actinomycetota bacterium]